MIRLTQTALGALLLLLLVAACNRPVAISELTDFTGLDLLQLRDPYTPAGRQLKVVVTRDLIPQAVFDKYQRHYGVEIELIFLEEDSDSAAFASALDGADIILTSSIWFDALTRLGVLQPLDFNRIPNIVNLSTFGGGTIQQGDVALPLLFDSYGIAFNSERIGSFPLHWDVFFQAEDRLQQSGRTAQAIDMGSLYMTARALFGSVDDSSTVTENIHRFSQDSAVQFLNRADLVSRFIDNQVTLAPMWSSDATYIMERNGAVRFSAPGVQPIGVFYGLALFANSQHADAASFFINYLLIPEVSAAISNHSAIGNFNRLSNRFVHALLIASPAFAHAPNLDLMRDYHPSDEVIAALQNLALELHTSSDSEAMQPVPSARIPTHERDHDLHPRRRPQ